MNFTNETFDSLRKRSDIFDAITLMFTILTIVFLAVGGAAYGSEAVSDNIALGLLALGPISFILCLLAVNIKCKSLLKFVGLKHGQTVYVVVHRGLHVKPKRVHGIDPWSRSRPVRLYSVDLDPEWKNIYLSQKEADEALETFISRLCHVVFDYIGYEGPLSRSERNEIMEGYKKFLSNNRHVRPTEFNVEDLVTFIVNHRKKGKNIENEKFKAKEALRNSFSGANREGYVKVECVIPIWLKELAEKNTVDCSALLKEALESMVGKPKESPYCYPDQMEKILKYLNETHTELNIPGKAIERLYRQFSEDCYCAGWLEVTDELIEEFVEYLFK